MSYSNTFCRKCEKNTYVNLQDSNMLCASCIREINEVKTPQKKESKDDGIIHKNIRWLQSWLLVEGVTSSSAYLYWRAPKYKEEEFYISNYLIEVLQTGDSHLVNGQLLGYKLKNLDPGSLYNVTLYALDKNNKLVNVKLKTRFTTATLN